MNDYRRFFLIMKKILLLLIIFIIKLNAYEYIVYDSLSTTNLELRFYSDNNGRLYLYRRTSQGQINRIESNNVFAYSTLSNIKQGIAKYVSKNVFDSFYKNDINFLNDLYLYYTQNFLNYLYNPDSFSLSSHILYENYEILYDKNGLAVSSIVDGVWAGLYDNYTKNMSGRLYSSTGQLLYINGVELERANFFDVVKEMMVVSVAECFGIASRGMVFITLLSLVVVLAVVMACIYWLSSSVRRSSPYIATFNASGDRVGRWYRRTYHIDRPMSSYRDFGFGSNREYVEWNRNRNAQIERKRRVF